jgi:hypothetical protein
MLPWPDELIAILLALLVAAVPPGTATWPTADVSLAYRITDTRGEVLVQARTSDRVVRLQMPGDDAVMLVDLAARSGLRLVADRQAAFRLPPHMPARPPRPDAVRLEPAPDPQGAAGCQTFLLSAPGLNAELCLSAGVIHEAKGTLRNRPFAITLDRPPVFGPLADRAFRVPEGWQVR